MAARLLRYKQIGHFVNHPQNHLPKWFYPWKASLSTTSCKANSEERESSPLLWQRSSYKYFLPIQTRWSDNDQYGHVNNVVYYSYYDTIINHYLIRKFGLNTNVRTSKMISYMVDTGCTYRSPISFPQVALAGLAVSRIGRSSVSYSVAIFAEIDDKPDNTDSSLSTFKDSACAIGHCTHVFVDTGTNRPINLPDVLRAALQEIHMDNFEPSSKL